MLFICFRRFITPQYLLKNKHLIDFFLNHPSASGLCFLPVFTPPTPALIWHVLSHVRKKDVFTVKGDL